MPTASSGFGSTRIPPRERSRPISTCAASSTRATPDRARRRSATRLGFRLAERWASRRSCSAAGSFGCIQRRRARAHRGALEVGGDGRRELRVQACVDLGSKLAEVTKRPSAGSGLRWHSTTRALHGERTASRERRSGSGAGTTVRARSGDRVISRQPVTERLSEQRIARAPADASRAPALRRSRARCGASRARGRASARPARAARPGGPGAARPTWCRSGAASCAAFARRARGSRSAWADRRSAGSWRSRIRLADPITSSQEWVRSSGLSAPTRSTNGTPSDASSARTSASSPSWISRERGWEAGAWVIRCFALGFALPSAGSERP